MARRVIRGIVRPAVVLLVVGFAILYLARNGDRFLVFTLSTEPWRIAGAVGCGLLYWLSLATAWAHTQAILAGRLSLPAAIRVWSLSTVARYVPGNIWHIAGRAVLAKEAGGDPIATVSASAYEQVLTVLGALLAGGLLVPLAEVGLPWWIGYVLVPLTVALIHPRVIGPIIARAADLFGWPRPRPLATPELLRLLGWYCLPNLPAGLALVLIGRLGASDLPVAIGAFAVAWAIGYLSVLTPSGLGPREITLAAILSVQIGLAEGDSIAIGHRLMLTAAELLLATFTALWRAGRPVL